jgi:hypothetical protein
VTLVGGTEFQLLESNLASIIIHTEGRNQRWNFSPPETTREVEEFPCVHEVLSQRAEQHNGDFEGAGRDFTASRFSPRQSELTDYKELSVLPDVYSDIAAADTTLLDVRVNIANSNCYITDICSPKLCK